MTKPADRIATGGWNDAAAVVFLILSFANLVMFYRGLIGF